MGKRSEKKINEIAKKTADLVSEKISAPYSGGNEFETNLRLEIQDQINKSTMFDKEDSRNVSSFTGKVNKLVTDRLKDYQYEDWQLINLHGDYFVNTCKFKVNDNHLRLLLMQIIRCSFLFGKAGLYFDKIGEMYFPRAVYIRKIKFDIYGNISKCEIAPIQEALISTGTYKPNYVEVISGTKLMNLKVFQWGSLALGAYVNFIPFVRLQKQLLGQMNLESLFYNKKWVYKLMNNATSDQEIKAFLDPNHPVIIEYNGKAASNKFDTIDSRVGNISSSNNFIEFYREVTNIYYDLLGRRSNVAFKKERNVTMEVESEQESFNNIQEEWLIYFGTFIKEVNLHEYMTLNNLIIEDLNNVC